MEEDKDLETTFDTQKKSPLILTSEEAKLIISMIEVVNKRNGFTPKDFTAVGKIYDKISSIFE